MNITKINLTQDGLLIVEKSAEERKTKAGIVLEENTDDMLVHGTVLKSTSEKFAEGDDVVFHILDSETFRDEEKVFYFVSENKIKGTYGE